MRASMSSSYFFSDINKFVVVIEELVLKEENTFL